MSANFYVTTGQMVGLDVHKGTPMLVFTGPYIIWPGTFSKQTHTVTADGLRMIREGHKLYMVQHIPCEPSPKAILAAILAVPISTSEPFLCRRSVRSEGSPLACCVKSAVGTNANCWDMGPVSSAPSGFLLSYTTVKTTPSLGDLAAAAVGLLFDNILGAGMSKAPGGELGVLIAMIRHAVSVMVELLSLVLPAEAVELIEWMTDPLKKGGDTAKGYTQDRVQKAVDQWVEDSHGELF